MEQIKYRAWNDVDKMMVEWGVLNASPVLFMNVIKGKTKHHQLMQFTGSKDVDGKDIYEGDILSHSTNYRNYNCVIEWNDSLGSCGCCYDACESVGFIGRVLKGSNYTYSKLASGFSEMTIIGNIYENPELMGDEND